MSAPAFGAEAPATDVSEVIVTAAPFAVSIDSMTTSVNIVTRAQLQTVPAVGLGDVLNGMAGLRSTFYGPGASRPIIRGLSGPRVLILQNGVERKALMPSIVSSAKATRVNCHRRTAKAAMSKVTLPRPRGSTAGQDQRPAPFRRHLRSRHRR